MRESITVLGAGSVGVASAIHLQQRGWDVTLIDRKAPGRETSCGNAGVINPGSMVPLNSPDLHSSLADLLRNNRPQLRYQWRYLAKNLPWVLAFLKASKTRPATAGAHALHQLTQVSLEEHQALMQRTGNMHRLNAVSWMKVYRGNAGYNSTGFAAAMMKECGVEVSVLGAAEVQSLEPALKPVFTGGMITPGGGCIDNPGALVNEYAQQFVKDGGTVLQQGIETINRNGHAWELESTGRLHRCDRLVVAAGPWSGDVLAMMGYAVPLGVERGYHAHYQVKGDIPLGRAVHDVDGGFVMAPMEPGLRVTTGVELNARDAPSDLSQLQQVEPRVREAIVLGERYDEPVWRGSRPTLPDSVPAIGAVPGASALWVNFGHQHIGLMTGPISGKLLAQLISHEATDVDLAPYSPARYITRAPNRSFIAAGLARKTH